jgi:hypothetical protein
MIAECVDEFRHTALYLTLGHTSCPHFLHRQLWIDFASFKKNQSFVAPVNSKKNTTNTNSLTHLIPKNFLR